MQKVDLDAFIDNEFIPMLRKIVIPDVTMLDLGQICFRLMPLNKRRQYHADIYECSKRGKTPSPEDKIRWFRFNPEKLMPVVFNGTETDLDAYACKVLRFMLFNLKGTGLTLDKCGELERRCVQKHLL